MYISAFYFSHAWRHISVSAGDAIIAIFPMDVKAKEYLAESDDAIPESMLSEKSNFCAPVVCGLLLKDMVYEEGSLTVHVAISCGEVCFGVLGGYHDRFESLISGPCLAEISECLDEAQSGHCVITGSVVTNLGLVTSNWLSATKLASGNYRVSSNVTKEPFKINETEKKQQTDTQDTSGVCSDQGLRGQDSAQSLSKFVPLPVLTFIENGVFNYLVELREITIVFMKWDSFDPVVHRDLLSLQRAFLSAQTTIQEAGGFIRQFLVDDKGCVLIACWGVPTCSYLDNAHRALSASITMREQLAKMSMKCSFGITTGSAYCGSVGSNHRQEYAMIGDVVNMAARLMGKAMGGIYIDDATNAFLETTNLHPLKQLAPIKVKGKVEPVQVFSYDFDLHHAITNTAIRSSETFQDIYFRREHQAYFTEQLDKLVEVNSRMRENSVKPSLKKKSFLDRFRGLFSMPSSLLLPCVKDCFTVMDGVSDSGTTIAIDWLQASAERNGVKAVRTSLAGQDSLIEFRAIANLFRYFLGNNVFFDRRKQQQAVKSLLKRVYGNDISSALDIGLVTLQDVLGISKTMKMHPELDKSLSADINSVSYSMSMSLTISKTERAQSISNAAKVGTVVAFCNVLLSECAHVVIIENIHFADAFSLQVLHKLQHVLRDGSHARALFVMTSESASTKQDHSETSFANACHLRRREKLVDISSLPWLSEYRSRFLSLQQTRLFVLDHYRRDEIENHLLDKFPEITDATVHKHLAEACLRISNGHPFWLMELMKYMKHAGVENVLHIIQASESAAERNSLSSKLPSTSSSSTSFSSRKHTVKNDGMDNTITFRKNFKLFGLNRAVSVAPASTLLSSLSPSTPHATSEHQ